MGKSSEEWVKDVGIAINSVQAFTIFVTLLYLVIGSKTKVKRTTV